MNKKTKETITKYIDEVLNKADIVSHKTINFEDDDDINFLIVPRTNKTTKNNIDLKLILYCSDENAITLYCPTLYRLQDKDTLLFTLNAINEMNNKIALGKIYLSKDNESVISYLNRVLFNDLTHELTPEILNEYISAFLFYSINFYKLMKGIV